MTETLAQKIEALNDFKRFSGMRVTKSPCFKDAMTVINALAIRLQLVHDVAAIGDDASRLWILEVSDLSRKVV